MATADSHCIVSIDDGKEIMATTDSECKVWMDDLAKKFESNHRTASNGTIHKVPEFLVMGNEKDYTPRLVSIGPYHLQNPKLDETNKLKEQFLQNLINRSPQLNSREKLKEQFLEALEKYLEAVRGIADDPIGKYSSVDSKNNGDDKLATMMVVDGCFIIELFLERLPGDYHPRAAPNISKKQLAFLHTDVLLVGNQIPFSVLEALFKASPIPNLDSLLKDARKGNSDRSFTFTDLALAYFEQDELIGASTKTFYSRNNNMSSKFDHLLHLYHSIWKPSFMVLGQSPEAQQPNEQGQRLIPEAQQPNEQQPRPTATTAFHCAPGYLLLFFCCWAVALQFLIPMIWKLLKKLVMGLLFVLHFAVSFIISPRNWKDLLSIKQPSLDTRNARFLHDMGIKFKKNTEAENWRPDISPTEALIKIPAMPIHQRSIIVFRNMVAFEELNSQSGKNFTAFAKFMDTLINTEKDVAILRKCGIIQSELDTDKEVADFFNNLCTVTVLDRGGHGHGLEEDPFEKLGSYYKDNRYEVMIRQWRMTFIPDSLRSAWAIPAIILGLIVVLPSILQTINTIYSLINPPPHPQQLISAY